MIMSSSGLNRNVLLVKKVVKEEAARKGRCLIGRRAFSDEWEGKGAVDHYGESKRGRNESEGSGEATWDQLPAMQANI
jgi:hypothetical protein